MQKAVVISRYLDGSDWCRLYDVIGDTFSISYSDDCDEFNNSKDSRKKMLAAIKGYDLYEFPGMGRSLPDIIIDDGSLKKL